LQGEEPRETTQGGEDGHAGPEGEFCLHTSVLLSSPGVKGSRPGRPGAAMLL